MKKILAVIAMITSLAISTIFLIDNTAHADKGDSGTGGDLGSKCSHYCTSWGAGWHKQTHDVFSSWAYDTAATGASPAKKAEIINRCAETPYIYRLSFERSNNRGHSFVANQFAGLVEVGKNVPYKSDIAEDWDQVHAHFKLAELHGVTSTTWENTAWFCYDPEWEPPCDPNVEECEPEPESESGNGYFWSTSKVEAVSGGDVPSGIEALSEEDGEAEIKFSTDQASVNIKFTHNMGYTSTTEFSDNDQVDDTETEWTVYQSDSSGSLGNSVESDKKFTAEGGKTKAATAVKDSPQVTVSLEAGQTKTVCQTIVYEPKYITYTKTSHAATATDEAYDEYTDPTGSGSGRSSVCATITRPSIPDSGDGTDGTGSTSSNIMFAGEQAEISWNVSGNNTDTRRLREWEAVVYRIPVNIAHSASLYTGSKGAQNGNQPNSACSWYKSHDYCAILNGRNGSFGENGNSHSYNESASIVVPDTVGYKYCNSFGYRYEYWWYSSSGGGWHKDKSYWRVHDSACRTIAKKPSVAIWNGGVMTAGGVTTSSASRFDNAVMGKESSDGGTKTLFGSWTEYLGVIGRNVNSFASGSSFAIGSKNLSAPKSNPLSINNSPLTIANKNRLGSSGVLNNSTYFTRLTTFLESRADRPGGNTLSAMDNVPDTRILRYDGNLKIIGNITTNPGNYNSIYNIPQVVIFVHGNLEIASNVTRIDAWLIVDGKINTCGEFEPGVTEADAIARLRDTCNSQLVFNGPVLAKSMDLRRSFGSDPLVTRHGTFGSASNKHAAGEVFNLRADTYLWAYAQAGRYDSSYTESYSRELAPRY